MSLPINTLIKSNAYISLRLQILNNAEGYEMESDKASIPFSLSPTTLSKGTIAYYTS